MGLDLYNGTRTFPIPAEFDARKRGRWKTDQVFDLRSSSPVCSYMPIDLSNFRLGVLYFKVA